MWFTSRGRTHVQAALDLDPTYVKAMNRLASSIYSIGPQNYGQAIELFQKSLEIEPNNKGATQGLRSLLGLVQKSHAKVSGRKALLPTQDKIDDNKTSVLEDSQEYIPTVTAMGKTDTSHVSRSADAIAKHVHSNTLEVSGEVIPAEGIVKELARPAKLFTRRGRGVVANVTLAPGECVARYAIRCVLCLGSC